MAWPASIIADQAVDWPRLAEAWGSLRHALALRERLQRASWLKPVSDLVFDPGVLDIALWPSLERQAAGLPAFRSYHLRGSQEWPAVAAWLEAMDHRPSVRAVASDDGTLVRLLSLSWSGCVIRPYY